MGQIDSGLWVICDEIQKAILSLKDGEALSADRTYV